MTSYSILALQLFSVFSGGGCSR